MPIEVIKYQISVLKAKLAQCERLDLWEKWTWEDEHRLEELTKLLKEYEI